MEPGKQEHWVVLMGRRLFTKASGGGSELLTRLVSGRRSISRCAGRQTGRGMKAGEGEHRAVLLVAACSPRPAMEAVNRPCSWWVNGGSLGRRLIQMPVVSGVCRKELLDALDCYTTHTTLVSTFQYALSLRCYCDATRMTPLLTF